MTPLFRIFLEDTLHLTEFVTFSHVIPLDVAELPSSVLGHHGDLADRFRAFWTNSRLRQEPGRLHRLWVEVMLSRSVDNFNAYVSHNLLFVFTKRAETLRNGDKVEIRDVLQCLSMEEFTHRMAERKVEELSYGSFGALKSYITERLGVPLTPDESVSLSVQEALSSRNLIVHNRGIVNERFRRETGRNDLQINTTLPLDLCVLDKLMTSLRTMATHIDEAMITKFGQDTFEF